MTTCICEVEPVKAPHLHDPDCRKWAPPPAGPGSTVEGRVAALKRIREELDAKKHRDHVHLDNRETE
jgi:hypothetical protein